jgi:hypothetical protein
VPTDGISPKVIASAITGVVVYLLTKLAISVDPVIEQAINVAAMVVAGYLAPSGALKEPSHAGPGSDALLPAHALAALPKED